MLRTRLPSLVAACLRRSLSTSRVPVSPQAYGDFLSLLPDLGPVSKLPPLRWDYDRDDARSLPHLLNQKRKQFPILPELQPHLEQEPDATTVAPGLFIGGQQDEAHKDIIRRFNVSLQMSYRNTYHGYYRKTLISCYEALKRDAPSMLNSITPAAWTLLWKVQITFRPLDPERLSTLEMLAADRETYSPFDQEDKKFYRDILDLEQQSENGKQEAAVEQWEQMKHYLETGRKGRKSWMELGARLHAMAGDIDAASACAEDVVRRYQIIDPRLRFFTIWRNAELDDADAIRRATALYSELMHSRRSCTFSTDDYHSIFAAFLKGGHINIALDVVKDVAKDEYLSDDKLRFGALNSMIERLQEACTQRKMLNTVSLACLGFLPAEFKTEQLFRNWIKNGERFWAPQGDDVCAEIVELMFERGDAPDARHLNVLLKAWFANKKQDFTKQAESVAWGMIHKRLDTLPDTRANGDIPDGNSDAIPPFLQRRIPPAAADTFTQLADEYARQGKMDYAFYVLNLLQTSNISMDKKALRSIIQLHITHGESLKAWQVFADIRDAHPSSVTLHAYHDLWKGLINFVRGLRKKHEIVGEPGRQWHRKIRKSFEGLKYPNPRYLFADMLVHIQNDVLKPASSDGGQPDRIPRHLYDRVVGTMLFTGDLLGATLAMEIMRNTLRLYPTLTTIKMIVQYTADEARKTEVKQGIVEPTKHYYDMAYGVLEYIYVNLEQHEDGRTPKISDLYNEALVQDRGEDVLEALTKYLRLLMQRYWGSEEKLEQYEFAARGQMVMSSMEAMMNRKLDIYL